MGRGPNHHHDLQVDLPTLAGPLPRFQGIDLPSSSSSTVASSAPSARSAAAAPQPPKSRNVLPSLSPEDRAKYYGTWQSVNPSSDLLEGEKARDVFQKSRLPIDQLGQIWALTDTRQRGALDSTEFIVAMHLVQSMMNGSIKSLPGQLPPGLFEAASNGPSSGSVRSQRQQSSISSVRSQEPLQQQFSGQRQTVPMRSQLTGPPGRSQPQPQMSPVRQQQAPQQIQQIQPQVSGQVSSADWDVKPHEKANYDNVFSDIDKAQKGYITGEEAVNLFTQSKLSEEDLALVWDLADIENSGQLTRDTFAVAMHLIKGKMGGRAVPAVLPSTLVPPSMRTRMQPPTAAVFAEAQAPPAPQQHPSSAAADLFGLNDSFSAPPPSKSPPAQAFLDNFGGIDRVASPPALDASQRSGRGIGGQPAFVPSSSFGQSIQVPNHTGSAGSMPQQQHQQQYVGRPQPERDLLSDGENDQTRNINNESTEVANLNNQMASLNTQRQQNSQERGQIQADVANLQAQKAELTSRLAQVRKTYDEEVKTVRAMQVEQGTLRSETRELIKEASLLEASLDAVKQQHGQISAQLEKDRADNLAIKERIKSANDQTVTLKATLEKVQRDAKQQRGLVAINTKQLNTLEAGHEKLNSDIEQEQTRAAEEQRIASVEQERRRANEEQRRSAMISPALSTVSASTNPFHRMSSPVGAGGGGTQSRSLMSPFGQQADQNTPSSSAFSFVKPAAAGAALTGVGAAAAAVAFGGHEHTQSGGSNDNGTTDSFAQNGEGRGSSPEATAGASVGLSGFNAFGDNPTTVPVQVTSFPSDPIGFLEPGVGNGKPDTGDYSNQEESFVNVANHDQSGSGRELDDLGHARDRQLVSPVPVPVPAQAQNWSDADPFTADPRIASPSPQVATRPMPAAVANLAIPSQGSDDGSVGTSVQAQAPASVRDVPSDSRPLTPASMTWGSEANVTPKTDGGGIESATREHELEEPVSASAVQETLSQAPQDEFNPMQARDDVTSPAESSIPPVPGAFPEEPPETDLLEERPAETTQDRSMSSAPSAQFAQNNPEMFGGLTTSSTERNAHDDPRTHTNEHTAEVDSSDDETIEQPRGADFFSPSSDIYSSQRDGTIDTDSVSTHTITKQDTQVPSTSFFSQTTGNGSAPTGGAAARDLLDSSPGISGPPTTSGLATSDVDEFDEFDDLEEATEADDDDEMGNSFSTSTNDFDPSFDAPPARSSFVTTTTTSAPQNMLMTPQQLPQPRPDDLPNQSPARDFSEFAHYGAVLGAPSGLAPPIRDTDETESPTTTTTTTNATYGSSRAVPTPAGNAYNPMAAGYVLQTPRPVPSSPSTQQTPTTTTTTAAAPTPPVSRHGASLAPPRRPEPARAISAADDPMLIELMDMGFDRDKSVGALEQFNYDLGAATDWLLKGN